MTREKLALWIAPLAVPFAFVGGISGFDMSFGIVDYLETVLFIAVFSLPIAYLIELFVGIPAYLVFKKLGFINFFTIVLGGAFVASSPLALMWLLGVYDGEEQKLASTAPLFLFIGAVTGFTFWAVLNSGHITRKGLGRANARPNL
jgi:hypothetical protein